MSKPYRIVIRVVALLATLMAIYVAYGFYAEAKAQREVRDFCQSVQTGEDPSAVLARAEAAGAQKRWLRWREGADGERLLLVMFIGLPPFSRHICEVRARQTVTGASTDHLD